MNEKRSPGRPRSEELTARRHKEILEGAARIFAARGYAQTDLQALADELGIGKGTLYRYFPSKRELFLAAVDRGMRALHDEIEQVKSQHPDPIDGLGPIVRAYLAYFDAHPECVELIIQERAAFKDRKRPTYFEHRDAVAGERLKVVQHLVSEGRIRDVPPERIIEVVNNLLYGTIFTNYFTGQSKPLEIQANDILDILLRGVLSDEERKRGGNA